MIDLVKEYTNMKDSFRLLNSEIGNDRRKDLQNIRNNRVFVSLTRR